jgi:hypothetical protein
LVSAGIGKLTPPIIATSALVLYEGLVTSMFAEPSYRYFHNTELVRLVIVGFGIVFVSRLLAFVWPRRFATTAVNSAQPESRPTVSALQYDFFDEYFGRRRTQLVGLLVVLTVGLFAWWTSSFVAHTWGAPPIEIVSATYGQSCGGVASTAGEIREGNVTSAVQREICIYHRCPIKVDNARSEDPAPGCAKEFSVSYRCKNDQQVRMASIAPGASEQTVELDCYTPAPEQVASGLHIRNATYGGNCGAPSNNAIRDLAKTCNGRSDCNYVVDVDRLGDPAPRCGKDFAVQYSCAPDTALLRKDLPAEAGLKSQLELSCVPEPVVESGLNIRRATYGASCDVPPGNVTKDLANSCNGRADCDYVVDVERLGDPAPRCGKDFQVEYSCAPDATLLHKDLPAEAGLKSKLRLSCAPEAEQAAASVPSAPEAVVDFGLNIRSATYGANCGASPGNATKDLANSCNGRDNCNYFVDVDQLGDPAPRCGKDFQVEYSCAPATELLRKQLPGEAGLKSQLQLSCVQGTENSPGPNSPVKSLASSPEPVVSSGLRIHWATYGRSCGAPTGNVTKDTAASCNGRANCDYVVDVDRLGDPAPRCGKDFQVEYSCAPDTALLRKDLPAEAGLKSQLRLSCTPKTEQVAAPAPTPPEPVSSGLNIRSATYGASCGAPTGNVTRSLANSCNGRANCNYVVDVEQLGDPAPRCGKDFQVEYSCAPDTALLRKQLPAEAGLRSELQLSCTPEAERVTVPPAAAPTSAEPVVESGLKIRTATYGGNCGAASGNATRDVANSCNGRADCDYVVDVERLRDPAPRCSKDFVVQYSCAPNTQLVRKELPGEAGFRSRLQLSCPSGATP